MFSGVAGKAEGGAQFSYLTNSLVDGMTFADVLKTPPKYPCAEPRKVVSMAVNLLNAIPAGATIEVRLLKLGLVVPDFVITFIGPVSGGILRVAPPVAAIYDTDIPNKFLDVQVVSNNDLPTPAPIRLSATLGIESI